MSRARFHAITTNKLYQLLFILFIAVLGAYIIVFFSVIKPILERKSNTGYTTQQLETNNGQAKTIDPASPTPATSPPAQKSSASNPNQTPSSNTAPQQTVQPTSPATVAAPVCDEAKKASYLATRDYQIAHLKEVKQAAMARSSDAYYVYQITTYENYLKSIAVIQEQIVTGTASFEEEYQQKLITINCK